MARRTGPTSTWVFLTALREILVVRVASSAKNAEKAPPQQGDAKGLWWNLSDFGGIDKQGKNLHFLNHAIFHSFRIRMDGLSGDVIPDVFFSSYRYPIYYSLEIF